jgi:hypothetical protein
MTDNVQELREIRKIRRAQKKQAARELLQYNVAYPKTDCYYPNGDFNDIIRYACEHDDENAIRLARDFVCQPKITKTGGLIRKEGYDYSKMIVIDKLFTVQEFVEIIMGYQETDLAELYELLFAYLEIDDHPQEIIEIIRYLVRTFNLDINRPYIKRDYHGRDQTYYLLHEAIFYVRPIEVLDCIIQLGGDPKPQSWIGTAYEIALLRRNLEYFKRLETVDRLFLESQPVIAQFCRNMVCHYYEREHDLDRELEILEYLLEQGYDPNIHIQDPDDQFGHGCSAVTAVLSVAGSGETCLRFLEILLKHPRVDVNLQNLPYSDKAVSPIYFIFTIVHDLHTSWVNISPEIFSLFLEHERVDWSRKIAEDYDVITHFFETYYQYLESISNVNGYADELNISRDRSGIINAQDDVDVQGMGRYFRAIFEKFGLDYVNSRWRDVAIFTAYPDLIELM